MQRDRNMSSALFLLCAILLHSSDGVAANSPACIPSHEVACFVPADHVNASAPVSIDICAGKKLNISLEHVSEASLCHWIREDYPVLTGKGSDSVVLPPLSKADSGEYMLRCENGSRVVFSLSVSVRVVMTRPTKPKMMLQRLENPKRSPYFTCISEGCPMPKILWAIETPGSKDLSDGGKAISTISSTEYFDRGALCCASNAEGQECSQLYDYDFDANNLKNDEVSNVTVSPGQPLLLRCRIKGLRPSQPVWEKDNKNLRSSTLACPSKDKEKICIRDDAHGKIKMAYLFIESVTANHSGAYTCRSPGRKPKSVYIHVQAEGFLSVQLDERRIIPGQNATSSCLQASVSYHDVLQKCYWEAPDETRIKCTRESWVTTHRTVKLCDRLKSGDYKLHLEAGGQKDTKTISVCVVDPPKFKFSTNKDDQTLIFETMTLVPANYTWMSCSDFNGSCDSDSSWTEIPGTSQIDSDDLCSKSIKSSMSRDLVDGEILQFCLTNSVDTWCERNYAIYPPSPLHSTGPPGDNDSSMLLKIGILLLFLALVVMSILLIYFKRKKPKYQPQLQMIQMVGPNDNDYIYINFKDFQYDPKWEFPRENLELGKELGSGAFGMVVQATAYGINKPGVSQQVAVKMLKDKHQTVEKEALMSELKMLTHIGHHANIVNLLGACTDSGPTYLIFQYCCYGDLLNYLKKNRELYHKSVTDAFNKDRFRSLYHNLQPRKNSSEFDKAVDNYVPMHGSTTRGQEDIALLTLSSGDMDGFEDPEVYDSQDDETEDLQSLTFDDLLSFAFQVAKGMEFLSSKNCIHRDLAARNVLVTKGRLVKIGDFGLARDIENDSNYVVRGNVRLPVKWMAPESTFQGIYTMQSDVWAYGILLWEIFSLGVTPYPGMKVDHMFYSMIERGFKMECPYYANESVYDIMCMCWALDPSSRPCFSKLVSFMCEQLTDREEKLYHNMLDQTSSDYQNASAILDISALTKQSDIKTQSGNDYCRTHATEEIKAEVSDSDAEEKLLKPSEPE